MLNVAFIMMHVGLNVVLVGIMMVDIILVYVNMIEHVANIVQRVAQPLLLIFQETTQASSAPPMLQEIPTEVARESYPIPQSPAVPSL
jgi:hypothetical protein